MSAYQRARENRNEFLSVTSKNMLRCDACKETISKKKSTFRKHINSVKHNDAKRAIQNSKKRDQSLLTFLRRKDEEDNPKGETLPEDMRLFRFDLVEAFLSAGTPLSKIDGTVIEEEEEKVQWWVRHARTFPKWSAIVRKLLLVQPSSASAERVFSLMNHFFTHLQENALEETVEASVMLRYNNNQRKKIQ